MNDVHSTLNRVSFNIFKEAMKKLKAEQFASIDMFIKEVLAAFFYSSLNAALEENPRSINETTFPKLEKYDKLKSLAL